MMKPADVFASATCTAPAERAARMRDIVLEHVRADRAVDVLDVGCGAGSLVFQLADALPGASLVGVDISPANITAAEAARAGHPAAARIRFEQADYLERPHRPVDVIVTDTALHFFRGSAERLWRKLSADLRPSGILVCCMAYDDAYNRTLRAGRRVLRAMRSAPVEAFVNGLARLAYGRALDASRLRERTEYMYIPPEQLMTADTRNRLAPSLGLAPGADREVPNTSATQLRQRITVFTRTR